MFGATSFATKVLPIGLGFLLLLTEKSTWGSLGVVGGDRVSLKVRCFHYFLYIRRGRLSDHRNFGCLSLSILSQGERIE